MISPVSHPAGKWAIHTPGGNHLSIPAERCRVDLPEGIFNSSLCLECAHRLVQGALDAGRNRRLRQLAFFDGFEGEQDAELRVQLLLGEGGGDQLARVRQVDRTV
jgi:hypothetical protein